MEIYFIISKYVFTYHFSEKNYMVIEKNFTIEIFVVLKSENIIFSIKIGLNKQIIYFHIYYNIIYIYIQII